MKMYLLNRSIAPFHPHAHPKKQQLLDVQAKGICVYKIIVLSLHSKNKPF
jgi:hypothetical protein